MNTQITQLHAAIQELESIGAWGLAQALRRVLKAHYSYLEKTNISR